MSSSSSNFQDSKISKSIQKLSEDLDGCRETAEGTTAQVAKYIKSLGEKLDSIETAYNRIKATAPEFVKELYNEADELVRSRFVNKAIGSSFETALKGVTLSNEALQLCNLDWEAEDKGQLEDFTKGMKAIAEEAKVQAEGTISEFRGVRQTATQLLKQCQTSQSSESSGDVLAGLVGMLRDLSATDPQLDTALDELLDWWLKIVSDLHGVLASLNVISKGTTIRVRQMTNQWGSLIERYQKYQRDVTKALDNKLAWDLRDKIVKGSGPLIRRISLQIGEKEDPNSGPGAEDREREESSANLPQPDLSLGKPGRGSTNQITGYTKEGMTGGVQPGGASAKTEDGSAGYVGDISGGEEGPPKKKRWPKWLKVLCCCILCCCCCC